jgi:hypothetical protein
VEPACFKYVSEFTSINFVVRSTSSLPSQVDYDTSNTSITRRNPRPSNGLAMSSPPPQRVDVLTISNLQKHTVHANETPRTKVLRYFNNQFEDSRILCDRDPSPIPAPQISSSWDVVKDFLPGNLTPKTALMVGNYQSPILGRQNEILPESDDNRSPFQGGLQPVFHSEDSDILVHNPHIQNLPVESPPPIITRKRKFERTISVYPTYSSSLTRPPEESKGTSPFPR